MTAPQSLPSLAQGSDVATALGVDGVTVLPETMQIRMDATLAKVSRRFRKEAQRFFSPGVYTTDLKIHAGCIRLQEQPNRIVRLRIEGLHRLDYDAWQEGGEDWALWEEGGDPGGFCDLGAYETPGGVDNLHYPPPPENHPAPRFRVDGIWLHFSDWDFWRLNGKLCRITYSWDTPVPEDVVMAVADITARNLTIDPLSAVRQSKLLMTRHFRQEMADWVISGGTGFTKDDIEQAQSYRYLTPPVIIANMSQLDMTPSVAFLSDSSW